MRIVTKTNILRFWQTLKEIDYIQHLITGVIIGSVIGGVVFSIVSPFIIPPVQDTVIGSGIGPEPAPEMKMMYEDETDDLRIHNSTNVSINSTQYRVFYTTFRNPTNKLITELNLLFLFSGCPESTDVYLTSLDSAVATQDSDDIEVKRLPGGCGIEVSVEELPPQKWATVFVVVDTTQTNSQIDRDLDQRQVAILGNYEWQYNGRMYFTKMERVIIVSDELEKGDRLN